MRQTITDRTGDDTTPLELHLEPTEWDQILAPGTWVCAIGNDGWRYYGQVISTDAEKRSYTINVTTASNKILDNVKQYSQGDIACLTQNRTS